MIARYEELLLLSPELSMDENRGIIENLTAIIEREGGTMVTVDDWGIKDTAYPVRKFTRGHYVRLEMDLPHQAVAELERNVRITDGILKFITVRLAETAQEVQDVL